MSLYAAPASCHSISFLSRLPPMFACMYNKQKANNLTTTSRLEIEIVYGWNTANGLVGHRLSTVRKFPGHFDCGSCGYPIGMWLEQ